MPSRGRFHGTAPRAGRRSGGPGFGCSWTVLRSQSCAFISLQSSLIIGYVTIAAAFGDAGVPFIKRRSPGEATSRHDHHLRAVRAVLKDVPRLTAALLVRVEKAAFRRATWSCYLLLAQQGDAVSNAHRSWRAFVTVCQGPEHIKVH